MPEQPIAPVRSDQIEELRNQIEDLRGRIARNEIRVRQLQRDGDVVPALHDEIAELRTRLDEGGI